MEALMKTTVELAHLALAWDETYLDYPLTNQWAHHDVVAMADGRIVTGHPDGTSLLVFSPEGRHLDTVGTGTVELHGIANDDFESDSLWIADPGRKSTPGEPHYRDFQRAGRILNVSLPIGTVLGELRQPDLEIYAGKTWRPTAVVRVNSGNSKEAGRETIWVSDGYGLSLLHQYSRNGTYLRTVNGEDSGMAFDTPHAIITRQRDDRTELLVADRSNKRIAVLSTEGAFIDSFGADSLTSPSGLAVMEDGTILVTELFGSVAAFSESGTMIGSIGAPTPPEKQRAGWPNEVNTSGSMVRPSVEAGQFNSPHGICIAGGAILVTEWEIGGRIIRLDPA